MNLIGGAKSFQMGEGGIRGCCGVTGWRVIFSAQISEEICNTSQYFDCGANGRHVKE